MDLPSISSSFTSKVRLRVFVLLLCLNEAVTSGTHYSDTISNFTKCSSEKTLESLISGILIPHPNSFQAVTEGDEVEIICMAPDPVYLRYTGYPLLEKRNANSSYERINDTCFTSTIKFKAEKGFTGEYECQTFGQNSSQVSKSSTYIYVNANESYLLLNSKGKNFTEINAGSRNGFIIPCAVSDPSTAVDLEKNNKNITYLYPFDPKLGFLVNSTTEYGLFKCTARGSNSYLEVNVVEPKASTNDISSAHKDTISSNITLNMYNDTNGNPTFKCLGASSMTVILCNTLVECDFFQKCVDMQGDDNCNESTKTGKACDDREDCQIVTIEKSLKSFGGTIFCSNSNSEIPTGFRFYVKNKGEPILLENATYKDTMNFGLTRYGAFIDFPFVEFGEDFSFQCNASKSVYSKGLQWGFVVDNAGANETHLVYPKNGTNDTEETSETMYSRTSTISFEHPELLKLHEKTISFFCRAPRIDSKRYDVIYHQLRIKVKSTHPKLYKNETIYIESDDFDSNKHYVNCTVKGNGGVYWTKKIGNDFVNISSNSKQFNKQIYINGQLHSYSSITVELTRPENPITYRCDASNEIQDTTVIFKTKTNILAGWIPTWIATILGISLFVLVICSIAWGYKLYKRENPFPENWMKDFFDGYEETNNPFRGFGFAPHEKRYEINPKYVTRLSQRPFGTGQSGLVSLVEYRRRLAADSILHWMKLIFLPTPPELITCVAKEPNEECRNDDHLLTEFLKEIKSNIQVGNHKNIVKFIGCMASPRLQRNRKAAILMEYCKLGDLKKFLQKNRSTFKDEFQTPSVSSGYASLDAIQTEAAVPVKNQISTSHLIQWAYEIACGLEYIASKNLYHRDVAARNVLLTEDRVAKIADLGLSRYVEGDRHYYRPIDEPTGNEDGGGNRRVLMFPIPWLPVESIRTQRFSEDSDIWAFGVTLWEIFSLGDDPIMEPDLSRHPHQFADHLAQGNRLPRPRAANQAIYDIMLRCWAAEGKDRPRFTELKELINETKSYLIISGSATTTATHAEYNSESASDLNGWSSGHQSSESDSENDYVSENSADNYKMATFNR